MTAIADAIAQAQQLLATLQALETQGGDGVDAAAPTDQNAHDNELPFKCPDCGKTFPTQVVCDNQHPPVATLPTDQVIAGAVAGDTTGTPALAAVPALPVSEGTPAADAPPPPPAGGATGEASGPDWPGGTA